MIFGNTPSSLEAQQADTFLVVNSSSLSDSTVKSYANAFTEAEFQVIEGALAVLTARPTGNYGFAGQDAPMDDDKVEQEVYESDNNFDEIITEPSSIGRTSPTNTLSEVVVTTKPNKKQRKAEEKAQKEAVERAKAEEERQAIEKLRAESESAIPKTENAEQGRRAALDQRDGIQFTSGKLYLSEGSYKKAQGIFLDLLRSDPLDLNHWLHLGIAYRKGLQPVKAIPCLKAVVDRGASPQYEEAQWELALSLLAAGRKAEAKAVFTAIQGGGGTYQQNATEKLRNF